MTTKDKQILAITHKIKTGKAKNAGKAKAKIREIKTNKQRSEWLAQ